MFARVITATAETGLDDFLDFAQQQMSAAEEEPGFSGYYVLTNPDTGNVVVISLWRTREEMDAVGAGRPGGIREEGVAATGLSAMSLETYEVALRG